MQGRTGLTKNKTREAQSRKAFSCSALCALAKDIAAVFTYFSQDVITALVDGIDKMLA